VPAGFSRRATAGASFIAVVGTELGLEILSAEALAFLQAPRCGVLATHGIDGEIHQAVVWYALTDAGILMNSLEGRRWPANLRRDPRVTIAVFDGEDYVIVRGTAAVIDDPIRGQRDARALAVRYGGDPDAHLGQVRVSILVDPKDVALHGRLAAPTR
jgi:PPOX class probable F420-dependent enzyme